MVHPSFKIDFLSDQKKFGGCDLKLDLLFTQFTSTRLPQMH